MQFPRSPFYFGALLILSGIAFYPLYLMNLLQAPIERHFHAVFGSLWLLALIVQPLLIRLNKKQWHKRIGVIALLCGIGFIVSFWTSLAYVVSSEQQFFVRYGEQVAFLLVLTALLFTFLFLRAIQTRHQVQQHARYMVATGLLTLDPVLERLLGFWVPGLMTSLDDVPFVWFLTYSCVLAVSGFLVWRDRDSIMLAFPFGLVGAFSFFKLTILYYFTSGTVWTLAVTYIATISTTKMFVVSFGVTSALVVLSWVYQSPAQENLN